MKKSIFLILLIIVLVIPMVLSIPGNVNVQGQLKNNDNEILTGTYNLSMRIYTTYTGGTILFEQNTTVTTDTDGLFNAILYTALSSDQNYYLEIVVQDETLSPRINVSTSPYSFRSNITDHLNPSNNYTVGQLNSGGNITTNGWFRGIYDWIANNSNYFTWNGSFFNFFDWRINDTIRNEVRSANESLKIFLDDNYVNATGDTMTGNLIIDASLNVTKGANITGGLISLGGNVGLGEDTPNTSLQIKLLDSAGADYVSFLNSIDMEIAYLTSAGIFAVSGAGSRLQIEEGGQFYAFSGGNDKWVSLYHDDINANLIVSGGGDLSIETASGYTNIADGNKLRIYASGESNYLLLSSSSSNSSIISQNGNISFGNNDLITSGKIYGNLYGLWNGSDNILHEIHNETKFRQDNDTLLQQQINTLNQTDKWVNTTGDTMVGNLTNLQWFKGKFNFSASHPFYIWDSSNLAGNDSWLNVTIDNRLISTTYYPSNYTIPSGTWTGGNLSSILEYDDSTLNITESTGSNPLTVNITFAGVVSFDWITIREQYTGENGHDIYIQLWDYNSNNWDTYSTPITDQTALTEISPISVTDAENHVSSGVVKLRLWHQQNGILAHALYIDYVHLVDGISTMTTIDHDSLGGRDDKENHPWAFPIDASRNISGNVTMAQNLVVIGTIRGKINITSLSPELNFNGSHINLTKNFNETNEILKATSEVYVNQSGDTITGMLNATKGINITGGLIVETGNTGLGTITPNDILHIKHEINAKGVTIESDTSDAYLTLDSAGGAGDYSNIILSKAGVGKGQIYTGDGADDDMHIYSSSDIVLEPDGFVGIGTGTPSTDLHILSASNEGAIFESVGHSIVAQDSPGNFDAQWEFWNDHNNKWTIFNDGGSGGNYFGILNAGYSTTVFAIIQSGNVGIGTISPSQKLEVVGSVNITRDLNVSGTLLINKVPPLTTAGGIGQNNISGRILFSKLDIANTSAQCSGTDKVYNVSIINGTVSILCEATSGGNTTQDILTATNDVYVNQTGDTMTGNLIVNANIGINDSSPSIRLQIRNDDDENATLLWLRRGLQDTTQMGLYKSFGKPYMIIGGGEVDTSDNYLQTIGFGYRYSAAYTPFAEFGSIATNDMGYVIGDFIWGLRPEVNTAPLSEVMRLKSGGFLGINTSSPQATLHVNGSSIFDGNVGIGTTSPSHALQVQGSLNVNQIINATNGFLSNSQICTASNGVCVTNNSLNSILGNGTYIDRTNSTAEIIKATNDVYVNQTGDTMAGHINMSGNAIKDVGNITFSNTEYIFKDSNGGITVVI